MISNSKRPVLQVVSIFEIKLLSILGFAPWVNGCVNCGKKEFENISFSFVKCGFICKDCTAADKSAVRLSEGAAKAIFYIVYSNMQNIFNFEASCDVLDEIRRVSKIYLKRQLEKDYKKMDFLKCLKSHKEGI